MPHKYWFKPARFWKVFAAYYPATWQGWLSSILLLVPAVFIFASIIVRHSLVETLVLFAPWAIAFMVLFDLLCFRTGEYPAWWKRRG